jgi:hypothetical protein
MHACRGTRDGIVHRHSGRAPRDKLIGWRLESPTTVWRRPPPGFTLRELQEQAKILETS